ncbi:MAG: 50S ribosomal protein L20 [Myxococcota bacterium]
MPRVKGGYKTHRRHKRVLKAAKGYFMGRGKLFRSAVVQVRRAWAASYKGRKQRKRDMRKLWIQRINAASRLNGLTYSRLIHKIKVKGVDLNRKMLADLAVTEPAIFKSITEFVKK